jgi:YD repeat-containing protein
VTLFRSVLILLCAGHSLGANAAIRLENRNLFLEFKDIVFQTTGTEITLERIYNSKSPEAGWFGPGWGSTLEVRLLPQADGSIIIREFGAGAAIRFELSPVNPSILDGTIRALGAWASSRGNFGTPAQKDEYMHRIRTDAGFREREMAVAVASGRIKLPPIQSGQQFVAAVFEYQYVTKTSSGFVRKLENGMQQLFDSTGRLQEIRKDRALLKLGYDPHGRISDLSDQEGKHVRFHFNSSGMLESVTSSQASVNYSYSVFHSLVGVQQSSGEIYQYAYDPVQKHLLTECTYPDRTRIVVKYEDPVHHEDVKYYKERNGIVTEIQSQPDQADPLHMRFEVTETTLDGHPSKTVYDYFSRIKTDGQHWTYRQVETRGGVSTETLFNECCGKPLSIVSGQKKTEYEYDPFGRVIRIVSGGSQENFAYDRSTNHLSRYDKQDTGSAKYSSVFIYDSSGKLIGAKDSSGVSFMLLYDPTGRLSRFGPNDDKNQLIEVTITSQPPGLTLASKNRGSFHLPAPENHPPAPLAPLTKDEQALIGAWDRLIDLIRKSNNPLPR